MIKRILHSWSFHMKFIELGEGSFHKFHIKRRSSKILYFHGVNIVLYSLYDSLENGFQPNLLIKAFRFPYEQSKF